MARVICLIIGYLCGLIQSAYIVGKMKGIDIREHGSGNAGTTNAMRVLGTKDGLIVFLMDALKAVLCLVIIRFTVGAANQEALYMLMVYGLAGCVLGHDYPFYMKFKGGKGVAVIGGFCLAFHWTFFPIGFILFFVPFLLTHYVSLGSLILYAGVWIAMVVEGQMGMFGQSQIVNCEMFAIMLILTAMAYYRHKANIGRLLHGNERKTYILHHEKSTQ